MISAPVSQADVLARSLEVRQQTLSPEVAQFWLDIELSTEDQERLTYLAERARQGSLSSEEQRDIEEYRRFGRLVETMKIKARRALKSP